MRGGAAAKGEDSEDNDGDDEHSATSGSADDDGHRVRCRGGAGRVWRGGVDNARALVLVVDCVCIAALWGEDALPRAADERRGPAVGARHLPNQRACVVLCRNTKSGERGVERERERVCVCVCACVVEEKGDKRGAGAQTQTSKRVHNEEQSGMKTV